MALCSIIELGLFAFPLWGWAPAWLSITRATWSYSGWVLWSSHLPQVLRVRPTGRDRRCSPTIRKIKPNTSVILIQKKKSMMGVFYVFFLVIWRKTSRFKPKVSVWLGKQALTLSHYPYGRQQTHAISRRDRWHRLSGCADPWTQHSHFSIYLTDIPAHCDACPNILALLELSLVCAYMNLCVYMMRVWRPKVDTG